MTQSTSGTNPSPAPSKSSPPAGSPPDSNLLLLVLGSILLRLVLGFIPGYPSDAQTFHSWAIRVAKVGPTGFFGTDWSTIAPGSILPLHVLVMLPFAWIWSFFDPTFAGWQKPLFGAWMKLPTMAADLVCAAGLYRIASRFVSGRAAVGVVGAFLFSPGVLLISSVWGHSDTIILALVIWGSVKMLEGRVDQGVALTLAACSVRSHALIFVVPALALAVRRGRLREAAIGLAAGAAFLSLVGSMFTGLPGLKLYYDQLQQLPYTTINAFNAWSLVGNWKPDADAMGLLPRSSWGLLAVVGLIGLSVHRILEQDEEPTYLREMALLTLGTFLFATRVHERHLVYPIAYLSLFGRYRRFTHLLSAILTLNILWLLGPSSAWGKAAQAGWGTFLTVLALMIYAWVQGREPDLAAKDLQGPPVLQDRNPVVGSWLESLAGIDVHLNRRDVAIMVVLLVGFGGLRLDCLAEPPEMIFDEVYHSKAGEEIYQGKAPNEWVHPPLAKLLIGLGIKAKGMNAMGWRVVPWFAGTLILPVFYVLCRHVIPDRRWAAAATFMFACDGTYFVLSRTAMTNVFALLWQICAFTTLLLYLRQASAPGGRVGYGGWLALTGLAVSLGLATRWTCLWMMAAVAVIYGLHTTWVLLIQPVEKLSWDRRCARYVLATCSGIAHFILLPAAIYLASYYPLIATGAYADYEYVVSLQPQIWKFHTTFTTHHPYYSQWYTWSFTHRPVWYHYKDTAGMISGIIALGNPLIWWASLPGVAAATAAAVRRRDALGLYACVAFMALYLPWALSPRVLNYSHYYLEPLPYACLAMTWLTWTWWRREPLGRWFLAAVVVLVALCFAFFHPILSGHSIPKEGYQRRIWSDGWI